MIGRGVGIGALLLLASLTWVQPHFERLDGATGVRYRWWVEALADGKRPQPWFGLFLDATGAPVDPGRIRHQGDMPPCLGQGARVPPPVLDGPRTPLDPDLLVLIEGRERLGPGVDRQLAAYATGPQVPADPWGQPWYLVVEYFERRGGHYRLENRYDVRSGGPNGRLDFGGDDVLVGPLFPSSRQVRGGLERPMDIPFDSEPLWALLALALGGLWLSALGLTAPRGRSLARELGLATCAAAFPGLVVFGCAHDARLDQALPVADGWLLVSPRVAAALSLVLALWGAILAWRLRRQQAVTGRPSGHELGEDPGRTGASRGGAD